MPRARDVPWSPDQVAGAVPSQYGRLLPSLHEPRWIDEKKDESPVGILPSPELRLPVLV
jgi:hypothetical protein